MFGFLKRWFNPEPELLKEHNDPILGSLKSKGPNWYCHIPTKDFTFVIWGITNPDSDLIEAAQKILQNWEKLEKLINESKSKFADTLPDEDRKKAVLQLRIEQVVLRPNKPNYAHIYFNDADGWNCSTCDLVEGKPQNLQIVA